MDFKSNVPIYQQIMQKIKSDIILGTYQIGEPVPSLREMSQQLNVNQNTVMRAYQQLQTEGILESRKGLGLFVTIDENAIQKLKGELAKEIADKAIASFRMLGLSDSAIVETISKELKATKTVKGAKA